MDPVAYVLVSHPPLVFPAGVVNERAFFLSIVTTDVLSKRRTSSDRIKISTRSGVST